MRTVPLAASLAVLTLSGCAHKEVPQPKYGPHTEVITTWADIDQPPPPVQVEEIGPSPGPGYVWIDGQWALQPLSQRWLWDQGKWCQVPAEALYYAKADAIRYRKVVGRVVRWNDALQRYEEVDSSDDRWHWIRGRFYGKAPDGSIQPLSEQLTCPDNPGIPLPK